MTGLAPPDKRARATAFIVQRGPPENLIEDDGAECCNANPSHREGAELKCEVAGSCRKRGCDGDQIWCVGEIYLPRDGRNAAQPCRPRVNESRALYLSAPIRRNSRVIPLISARYVVTS